MPGFMKTPWTLELMKDAGLDTPSTLRNAYGNYYQRKKCDGITLGRFTAAGSEMPPLPAMLRAVQCVNALQDVHNAEALGKFPHLQPLLRRTLAVLADYTEGTPDLSDVT